MEFVGDVSSNDGDGFCLKYPEKLGLLSLSELSSGSNWRGASISARDAPAFYEKHFLKWLEILLQSGELVFAAESDELFSRWMRCSYQWIYTRDYGPLEGLPLKPDPSRSQEELWIDNSLFPSRYEKLKNGYHVTIASHMWLGPEFWKIAACTPEQVKAQDWLKWEEWPHGVLYIHCWPVPFNRPDGEQGQLQKKLWRLLFDKDCHWPLPDGVGGPQAKPAEEKPPEPAKPSVCPYEPPQVATAVFEATKADLPRILHSMHDLMVGPASSHRGYYTVLSLGSLDIQRQNFSRLTLEEIIREFANQSAGGLTLLVCTGSFAIGICPSSLQPGKILARVIGPVGNPRWIPYLGSFWAAELAKTPGFELAWIGDVDTELGIPTPADAEKEEGHDHAYIQAVMNSPDRWGGRPIGSTMWFAPGRRKQLQGSPLTLADENGCTKIEAWSKPFSAGTLKAEESAVREQLQKLVHGPTKNHADR